MSKALIISEIFRYVFQGGQVMKAMIPSVVCLLLLFTPMMSFATSKSTDNVQITIVSVYTSSGDVLVQTYPRHDIGGLNCTSNFWLVLSKTQGGFNAALSMLLMAQTSGLKVAVEASDSGQASCYLRRVTTYATK